MNHIQAQVTSTRLSKLPKGATLAPIPNMKLYDTLPENLASWAEKQPVFFTGSAPTYGPHINVSPKGLTDSHFAILGPSQCAYIDRSGSGCETIAHSYENGRLCLMFISFGSTPRILRFFCNSRVVEWDHQDFPNMVRRVSRGKKEAFSGARAVIVCDIWQVQTSCGFGVPQVKPVLYSSKSSEPPTGTVDLSSRPEVDKKDEEDELCVFQARLTLDTYWGKRAEDNTIHDYQMKNNATSIDGLPGLRAARRDAGEILWVSDFQALCNRIILQREGLGLGLCLGFLLYSVLSALNLVPL